jgi:hypothetical protein
MGSSTAPATRPTSSGKDTHYTFWSLGATSSEPYEDGHLDGEVGLPPVSIQQRIRKIPEALMLTAGWYASRIPPFNELIRRLERID